MADREEAVRIAVLGLGYVGCVTAACLAHLGHRVAGVDTDEFKVVRIRRGSAPFYEPGLDELVREGAGSGRLKATTSLAEALVDAEMALICVGTPSERNGNLDLTVLGRVTEEIAAQLPERSGRLIVVVRSTVFPGVCEEVVAARLSGSQVSVAANPEFLREGSAVQDFLFPSLVVVGGPDGDAVARVASLYAKTGVEPRLVSLRAAEMIKYACNSFHALKIGFANEMGAMCSQMCIDGNQVMETLCRDVKLNLSPAYLKPGFAFGGSCLPKDLRALMYRSSRMDLRLPLVSSILPSNEEHLRRAMRQALDMPGERLGVYGLAFKEDTDDLRESPTVALVEYLLGKGREIRIFDPHIRLDQIYGSNRSFLFSALPHIGRLFEPSLDRLLDWAESLLLTQKPAGGLGGVSVPVLDLSGAGFPRREAATERV